MAPQDLSTESSQKRIVILKWKNASYSEAQTYLIRYHGKKNYYQSFNETRVIDTSGPVLSYKVQGLTPGTKYTFSVSSKTRCGIGATSNEVIEETQVDIPRAPVVSEVKETVTSDTSVFVIVRHVEEINGPISHYQFIVHHVNKWTDEIPDVYKNQLTDYEKSIKKKISFYITAQINAFTVDPSRTFQVGDGYNYGGYQNVPLVTDQKYKIYFRAVTTVPKYLPGNESVVALITVMEVPQIIKELSPSNILVAQDQTAFLRCFTNSSGSLKYDWLKGSSSIDHSQGLIWGNVSFFWKEQVVQGSMLQVNGKSEEELGEYTCSVTNEAGTTSHTVRLSRHSTSLSGNSSGQTTSLNTAYLAVIICLSIALILLVVFNVYLWRINRTRGAEQKYATCTTTLENSNERTEVPGENEVQAVTEPGNESTSPVQRGDYMELLPRRTREVPHGTQLDSSKLHYEIPQLRTGHAGENFTTEPRVSFNVNKGLEEQEIERSEIYEEIPTA